MATEISLADKDVAVDPTQEQAHAEVINISSDQTDMLSQAYSQRISSVLQTTMDLDKLFSLFSQQIRPAIPHTGMVYTNLDHEISISVGGNEGVACVYSLVANEESIGELTLYREWAMTQREVTVFEYTLRGLIYPLRNALLYKQALHAAHKDPLTGTFNRATFEETVERE
ncbi:MAG: hypothetical protein OEX00_09755, partial [Gammaproteobacteria bacterium]|nr:hypothetical protein [Gammaproteobacteria bacterium]